MTDQSISQLEALDIMQVAEFLHNERYVVARRTLGGSYRTILEPDDLTSKAPSYLIGGGGDACYLCHWRGERGTGGERVTLGQENVLLTRSFRTLARELAAGRLTRGVPCTTHEAPHSAYQAGVSIAYLVEHYGVQATNCLACAIEEFEAAAAHEQEAA